MLRSLVGSEMCIRDSIKNKPDPLALSRRSKKEIFERRVDCGMPVRLRSCLLYTSDAADDLLCVDLGGRRIIKQKTNMNIRAQLDPIQRMIRLQLMSQQISRAT